MAAPIPDVEPTEITAGDTAKWTRSLGDYPASDGWVLSYAFLREGDGTLINFSGTASGSDHLVNVAATDTAAWGAGIYYGQAYVTKAGERYNVWEGRVEVKPNFIQAGQIDPRSKAKRILDALKDISEKWAKKQTQSAVIEGIQFTFKNWKDLEGALNYWGTIVAREQGRARRTILTRFRAPAQWPPLIIPGQTGWP